MLAISRQKSMPDKKNYSPTPVVNEKVYIGRMHCRYCDKMYPQRKSIYERKGMLNGHRPQIARVKPMGIDLTALIVLFLLGLLLAGGCYILVSTPVPALTAPKSNTTNTNTHGSNEIMATGDVDVHPVYAALDENVPFAVRFTFTGNPNSLYCVGAWIYGGNNSVTYSQIWTNGNFSNTSASWQWRNQSYYTNFITNESGVFSHWLVLRSTGTIPNSGYDYVLRVRFREWNGSSWVTLNTVQYSYLNGTFVLINVTQPGSNWIESGGWIWGYVNSSTRTPLDNRVVVVKASNGTVLGTAFTEINDIDEGYDANGSGYYKVAVKAGTDYIVESWYDTELIGTVAGVTVNGAQGTHVDISASSTGEGITAFTILLALSGILLISRTKYGKKRQ